MVGPPNQLYCILLHAGQHLILTQAETAQQGSDIIRAFVDLVIAHMAGEEDVLSPGGLDYVDHVGHADDPSAVVKHWRVVQLEILALVERLIHWISFQHEGNLTAQLKGYDIVILSEGEVHRTTRTAHGRSFHFWVSLPQYHSHCPAPGSADAASQFVIGSGWPC